MTSLVEGQVGRIDQRLLSLGPRKKKKKKTSALVEVVKVLALDATGEVQAVQDLARTHALAADTKRLAQETSDRVYSATHAPCG